MRNNSWLVGLYTVVCVLGFLIALPNFLTQSLVENLPFFMPKSRIALGLDLRGGSHLVLEIDEEDFFRGYFQMHLGELRSFLRKENINFVSVRQVKDKIIVSFSDSVSRGVVIEKIRDFVQNISSKLAMRQKDSFLITENGEKDISIGLSQNSIEKSMSSDLEQSMEIVRQRIDQIGITEPTIQRLGSNRILVQLPGEENPLRLRQLLGTTAKMSFHKVLKDDRSKGIYPTGTSILKDDKGNEYLVDDQVEIPGIYLRGASANFDGKTGKPVVDIIFNDVGTSLFFDITRHNIGRPLGIVLDGKILTAPIINQAIPSGMAQISGDFTIEQAGLLATMLRSGALPVKLNIIEERSVGADLGSYSIYKGISSSFIGFILVTAFMVVVYGKWGLLADFALVFNIIFTVGLLTFLGGTLTLPGIAGIVLGIGLAVDSNVLINERIRSESRKDRSVFYNLDMGFSRAYSTIIDSNMTVLIATAVLFFCGAGPVRGFAITMGLSVLISMFTSISIVRSMMIFIVRYKKIRFIEIKPLLKFFFIPDNTTIQFMKLRFVGIGISILLSICSIILLFSHGLNRGIDFDGGIQIGVYANKPVDLSVVRSSLESLKIGEIYFQTFDENDNFLVRLKYQSDVGNSQNDVLELVKKKIMDVIPFANIQHTDIVGPKISGELIEKGVLGVIVASVAMLIYIWIRFEWNFAIGAIITLILDITKTMGFFSLTGIEFNLTAVAAILTLIGYSVNDKVVVYDCMRKNMLLYPSTSLLKLIDQSINETLGRSIYTSMTAFLSVLPMSIWGGSVIESFALPMVFGIFIAATSSIFIAAPIILFLGDWRRHKTN
ncbi:MAG: protein translocase subunit SecDF [Candidatus Liberibacter europaeus]|uniref:Multifunctional fusion protein n=1 Tax=Candidatus Liberibacter europaeus TaxID=744859 RepID=A0A2T4VWD5_9HYPH|nr:protein translocase subunit SecDF [Candidatus Liberibacter europaeus]PTL86088.1 MAG: protein translocase subunit SecDF [Candidatus Liberibacter europaeus]